MVLKILLQGFVSAVVGAVLAGTCAYAGNETSDLQVSLDDLSRFGVLGSVLAVDGPSDYATTLVSGHVDAEQKTPMTADRAFQIGSQTKTFTAAGILLLASQGDLGLDDPVRRYVPQAVEKDDVTIRHLLQHTSGLGDGIDLIDATGEPPAMEFSLDDILFLGKVQGRTSAPGERWHYNNAGYDILGRIIEVVSGKSRSQFLRKRLLNPLGMQQTWFGSEENRIETSMASGYAWSKRDEKAIDMTRPADLTWASAAGDMIATAGDLVLWNRSFLGKAREAGLSLDRFIEGAVATELPDMMIEYGNGLGHFVIAGRSAWGHGGYIHGYVSLSAVDPASGTVVVLLASLRGEPGTAFPALKNAVTMVVATALSAGARRADDSRVH